MKKLNRLNNLQVKRGMSLTEIILYLVIASIFLVGVFMLYQNASTSSRANEISTGLDQMRTGILAMYHPMKDFGGTTPLSNTIVEGQQFVPNTMQTTDGELVSNYGAITLGVAGTYSEQMTISLAAIPQNVCEKLTPIVGSRWDAVMVNATTYKELDKPVDTPTTGCAPGNTNTILLTARK